MGALFRSDALAALPAAPTHELRALATSRPNDPCVYWNRGSQSCTYAQVWQQVEQIARGLAQKSPSQAAASGGRVVEVVGLHFASDPLVVPALHGIWAAGKTVAVLNLSWSTDVLRAIVHSLGIKRVICGTGAELKSDVAGVQSINVHSLLVERAGNFLTCEEQQQLHDDGAPLWMQTMPEQALILHTSGSTGVPKSISVSAVSILLSDPVVTLPLAAAPDRRAILIRGLPTFLSRVKRIIGFPYLKSPLLFHPEPSSPGDHLADYFDLLNDGLADNVYFPPSLLRVFSEAHPEDTWPHISFIGLTGEKVLPEAIKLARRHFPCATISACYCGTETYGCNAVCCVRPHETVPDTVSYDPASPFGHHNVCVLIDPVSGDILPQKPGVRGVIHFSGPSLASGYIGSPVTAAPIFVTLTDGRRAVNLNDLGEWAQDGKKIIVLGRADRRVKINGIFVDLDFIDAALMADPAVGNAVTLKTKSDRLITFHEGKLPNAVPHLRRLLQEAVGSDYDGHGKHVTVHAAAWVPNLPKNASGKTHLARLQELADNADDGSCVTAPEINAVQHPKARRISQLCAAILGVPALAGMDFHMLDVGMDSVRAMHASSVIKKETTLEIGALLFLKENATPMQLAALCTADASGAAVTHASQIPTQYELPVWSLTCFGYTYDGDFDVPLPAIARPPLFHMLIDLTTLFHLDTRRSMQFSESVVDLPRLRTALARLGEVHPVLKTVPRPTSISFLSAYSTIASVGLSYRFDVEMVAHACFDDDEHTKQILDRMIRRGAMIAIVTNDQNGFIHIAFNHGPCTGTSMSLFRRHLKQLYHDPASNIPPHLPVDRASLWQAGKGVYPLLPANEAIYKYPTYHRGLLKLGRCLPIDYDKLSISTAIKPGHETDVIPLFVMSIVKAFSDALPTAVRPDKIGMVHLLDVPVPGRTGNSCLWSYVETAVPSRTAALTVAAARTLYAARTSRLVPDALVDGGTPDTLLFNIKNWDEECMNSFRHLDALRVQLTYAVYVELWLHAGKGLVEATLTIRKAGELAYGAAGGSSTVQAIARNLRMMDLPVTVAGV
ncbi:hypothetical protein HDU89_003214 [Geranomyces variabilis]|nr:hypothetical protein HDU89_003214 [Geranomyces variabilis]